MTRVLFVGQAQSRTTASKPPFSGASAKRLATWLGQTHEDFLESHDVMNLVVGWPGRARGVRGDAFDARAAGEAARLAPTAGRHVVLLGRAVAAVFGLDGHEPLSTVSSGIGTVFLLLPHPSGINRWYNEPQHVARARQALQDFVLASI